MTLTPEQVAKYESLAATGAKPKLPWEVLQSIEDCIEPLTLALRDYGLDAVADLDPVRLWSEDQLRAITAPLHATTLEVGRAVAFIEGLEARPPSEPEVSGPYSARETWASGPDNYGIFHKDDRTTFDAGRYYPAEARDIAAVRNRHHAARQAKENASVD